MLRGRGEERAAIDEMLRLAESGQGQGLILSGDPGIGKSALLGYAVETATGMQVLRTSGVEPETDIGYATLHRLLLPVLDWRDRLPDPQAAALDVVFGQSVGPAPDRFLVSLAVLSLLAEAALKQPVLCVVDDAHWSDAPSLDALAFVARRIEAEPIAVALAIRPGEGRAGPADGLVEIPLAGLDRAAARELLVAEGGGDLSAVEQDKLLDATGGNPLALRELPPEVRQGVDPERPLAIAAELQRAFLRRARDRSAEAQQLLLLLAAHGAGPVGTVRRAAGLLGCHGDLLTSDDLDDLVSRDGISVSFRHPLVRSAVYHGARSDERRAAHRALAAASGDGPVDLERRAWHLGEAADGHDEDAADELERAAEQALTRAGPAAAAAALEKAAELSTTEPNQGRRLVAAARAAWQAGEPARMTALLDAADRLAAGGELEPEIAELRAVAEMVAGTPDDALALLRTAIRAALCKDRRVALPLMLLYGEVGFRGNRPDAWADIDDWLAPLTLDGDDPDDVLARFLRGTRRVRSGSAPGLETGDLDRIEQLTDPLLLARASGLMWAFGDPEHGHRLRRKAEQLARRQGAAGALAWILEFLVFEEIANSRFATAEAHAEEGYRLAVETGQANTACRHRSSLALLAALRGRTAEARALADEVLAEANERGLADATDAANRALGLLDLVAGRHGEALVHFAAMDRSDRTATQSGLVLQVMPDLVEAAVRSGRQDQAAEALARFATWTEATRAPDLHALAARCRALLASGDAAEAEFVESLRLHGEADRPLAQARTALLYGQYLRRARRRSDARFPLRTALAIFRRIGAFGWADLAQTELRATGERELDPLDSSGTAHERGEQPKLTTLTPQELRIAMAVSEGATNREIAAQLFLSPRTVDYHLRKVFQKVQIGSRSELIRLVLAELPDTTTA